MKLTYWSHSCFLLETAKHRIVIDPFLSGNPKAKINADDVNCDYIIVTHGHGDHLGDTVELAKTHDALVITNFEIANHLSQYDIKVHPMHIGGRRTFDFGDVKMTPALHGSSIQTEDGTVDGGNPGGFLITIDGTSLYHAGDTGLTMDMKLLEEEHIDLALLPIGGNFTSFVMRNTPPSDKSFVQTITEPIAG